MKLPYQLIHITDLSIQINSYKPQIVLVEFMTLSKDKQYELNLERI